MRIDMYRGPERYIKVTYGIDGEGDVMSRAMMLPAYIEKQDPVRIQQALLSIVSRIVPDLAEGIIKYDPEHTTRCMEVKK